MLPKNILVEAIPTRIMAAMHTVLRKYDTPGVSRRQVPRDRGHCINLVGANQVRRISASATHPNVLPFCATLLYLLSRMATPKLESLKGIHFSLMNWSVTRLVALRADFRF